MAGSSQNQWFEVTGVSICIENYTDSDELLESYNQASSSNSENENQEKENRNNHEINRTPENLTMHDHISPEILESNVCSNESNVIEKNNEVHIDEGIKDNDTDVEILSTSNNFYDFKPLNTDSKRKLCYYCQDTNQQNNQKITPNIHNMGPPSATKTITATIYNCRTAYTNTENGRKNVWGTELEILACADLLKTDNYTFYNGSWIKYSSSQIYSNNCVNDQAIYLQHIGDINHYEVVTNVTQNLSLKSITM
ncbi:unnamed protein product [Mytilus coruscus]|uniref:OTU domain-containing protein n=1 Tax=Mytilus coruscus TaxID=42192 RepID=A0A6J8E2T7_MYTCO|nr:unnamed protein product [Mytilus coruscus]